MVFGPPLEVPCPSRAREAPGIRCFSTFSRYQTVTRRSAKIMTRDSGFCAKRDYTKAIKVYTR
jgi:hypothetical protein